MSASVGVVRRVWRRFKNDVMIKLSEYAAPYFLSEDAHYGRFDIGGFTYGRPKVKTWPDGTKLVIGKYCSIAEEVTLILGGGIGKIGLLHIHSLGL